MANLSADSTRVVYPLFQREDDGSRPISALQLRMRRVTMDTAIRLNGLWHSRLPKFTSPKERCKGYAAEYEGVYYAAAIWSPPLARMLNHTGRFELRRLAISPEAPKNLASRMLRVMAILIRQDLPAVTTLISYQDTSIHQGTIYKAAGWNAVNLSSGGEWVRLNRNSRLAQSSAAKIRWEKSLVRAAEYLSREMRDG